MNDQPEKKLTRQRRWQLRKKAEGRCTTCGSLRDGPNKDYCLKCAKRHNVRKRKRTEKRKAEAELHAASYIRYLTDEVRT